ncbi:MAG: hypothetical protein JO322_08295, partial [Candidatus Eremiobacteraeota bacterium]|nr:hypothetical protein [Candidatus Eremiobacteraeota bacterium]
WSAALFLPLALLACPPARAQTQPAYEAPSSPWVRYSEPNKNPDLGAPYEAYRLNSSSGEQRLIVYRLFTPKIYANLGELTEKVLKQYYPDGSFEQPKDVTLCGGLRGSTFSYTVDVRHDGHPVHITEVTAQADDESDWATPPLYAIDYVRVPNIPDDAQALTALRSLCPSKNEPRLTPPPFQMPQAFSNFMPPPGYQMIPGQTETTIGFVRDGGKVTPILAVRHAKTLFTSIAQFGAEQARLAQAHAATLNGFRTYRLLANRPLAVCAQHPVQGWYWKIAGTYDGVPSVARQVAYLDGGTLYSASYLRPASVREDDAAVASLATLCPRDGAASLAQATTPEGAALLYGDFTSTFDVIYDVTPGDGSVDVNLTGDDATSASFSVGLLRRARRSPESFYASAGLPSTRKPVYEPASCASNCTLELRGTELYIDAIAGGKTLAHWARDRYPALPTNMDITAAPLASSNRINMRAHLTRATSRGIPIPSPSCGVTVRGIEPRISSGGRITFSGSRKATARNAWIDLRTGAEVVNCNAASIDALTSTGTVGGDPALVVGSTTLPANGMRDVMMLFFGAPALAHAQTEWKDSAAMPDYGPLVAYAGRNQQGVPQLWKSRDAETDASDGSDAQRAAFLREEEAVQIAAGLDAGGGGSTLQALVQRSGRSPEALTVLAIQVVDAMNRASRQTVANSEAAKQWMVAHLQPGMRRENVMRALEAQGLKPVLTALKPLCSDGYVYQWWYQDEISTDDCSSGERVVTVSLPGAFQPGCSFTSSVNVFFDDRDRLQRLVLGRNVPDCL